MQLEATAVKAVSCSGMGRALTDLSMGRVVVVTGTSGGPVMLAVAEETTPMLINLMAAYARGLVGVVITRKRAAELGLELQPRSGRKGAPLYTRSIEASAGTTTGISAEDRARTIRAAAFGGKGDIVTPGHIFPQVSDGDLTGVPEVAIRLVGASGCNASATICTILDGQGEVADTATAQDLAARLGLVVVDVTEIGALSGPEVFS